MTERQCPKCGAPREAQHQFCPSCGYSYEKRSQTPPTSLGAPGNGRRDTLIIVAVIILTAVIYNVAAHMARSRESIVNGTSSTASKPILPDIIKAGNTYMDQRLFDKAIPQYEQALALDSLQPDVMVDLGACYHAIGENDKATAQFRKALTLSPKHVVALFNMGVVSLTVGDTAAARTWWTQYLEVATDSEQARMVRDELKKL
jgi:Tfp pilus assembly protein PilF